MKYTLISKIGNLVITTDNERKRDRLLGLGFKLVEKTEKEINLDKMTVEQLEAYAKEKGINLEGCNNKAEKLARIKETVTE